MTAVARASGCIQVNKPLYNAIWRIQLSDKGGPWERGLRDPGTKLQGGDRGAAHPMDSWKTGFGDGATRQAAADKGDGGGRSTVLRSLHPPLCTESVSPDAATGVALWYNSSTLPGEYICPGILRGRRSQIDVQRLMNAISYTKATSDFILEVNQPVFIAFGFNTGRSRHGDHRILYSFNINRTPAVPLAFPLAY